MNRSRGVVVFGNGKSIAATRLSRPFAYRTQFTLRDQWSVGRFEGTFMTHNFDALFEFLERLPAIDLPAGRKSIGHGVFDNGNWWVKFSLDTGHQLAWRHVQELG